MSGWYPEHKWWCDGQHSAPRYYQTSICSAPRERLTAAIVMPVASKADMDAAAVLLGYHPTHLTSMGSMFCDACATNVTTPIAMTECPNALPPVEAVDYTCGCGIYVHPSRRNPQAIHIGDCPYATGLPPVAGNTMRSMTIDLGSGRSYRVEERIATRGPDEGRPYLFCPCPAWRFGHQRCKHTDHAERMWAIR